MRLHVTEPDVAITDYFLAIESMMLAAWLIGEPSDRPDLRLWFIVFFVGSGCASALGGTVHGFFVDRPSRLGTVLWRATLVSAGVVAAAGWMIGAALLWGAAPVSILVLVAAELIVYAAIVIAVNDAFWVAVANYLPATGFLLVAYSSAYRSDPSGAIAVGLAGLALTVLAAAGQRFRVAIHPVYFSHNALYHAVQGIALLMLFWSGRHLIGA
jgi:hypothetical protein